MRFPDAFRVHIRGCLCIYCGENANTVDHFPPATFSMYGYLLPCCKQCNGLAGTAWPTHFIFRSRLVNDKIRRLYKRLLKTPDWTRCETAALGYNLRCGIQVWQKQREIALGRIAWSAVAYLASIDRNSVFVPIFAEDDFFDACKLSLSEMEKTPDEDPPYKPKPYKHRRKYQRG